MNRLSVILGGSNALYRRQTRALADNGFELDSGMGTGRGHWSNRWHTVSHPTKSRLDIAAFVRGIKGRVDRKRKFIDA